MNITNTLTDLEKKSILTNEYEFIKTLIPENVKLYKIPRVIYDLFAMKYVNAIEESTHINLDNCNPKAKSYKITCVTYIQYCEKVNTFHNSQLEHIFNLNNYIISYLKNKNINYKTPTYVDYMPMLQDNALNVFKLDIPLLTNTFIIETTQTYNKDKIMFFRGSADQTEGAVDTTKTNYGYSVSYNTSLLNGYINDPKACSYHYMKTGNFRHVYIFNKFWYGDGGVEDNLFFIPPIHPFLQILGDGELWHARSKIYKESLISHRINAYKIFTVKTFGSKEFPPDSFPDFLRSEYNQEQIKKRFKLFIAQHRAQIGHHRVDIKKTEYNALEDEETYNKKNDDYLALVQQQHKYIDRDVEANLFGGRKTKRKKTKRKKTKRKKTKKYRK
jgi:hypothetical protein